MTTNGDDGTTILPWSSDKPLARDVTVPDTYADAHVSNTATDSGAAASQHDRQKLSALQHTYFY